MFRCDGINLFHKNTLTSHVTNSHNNTSLTTNITDFIASKKSTRDFTRNKSKIHEASARLIAECNLPLEFFDKEGVKRYMTEIMAIISNGSPNQPKIDHADFCPSKHLVVKSMEDQASKIDEMLKKNAAHLVENGKLFLAMDDWQNTTGTLEYQNDYR